MLAGGHVPGLLIPASWTAAVGIDEDLYHVIAVGTGTFVGLVTVAGLAILLYRRFTIVAVRQSTTVMDWVMYALLAGALGTGMVNTMGSNLILGRYHYRRQSRRGSAASAACRRSRN